MLFAYVLVLMAVGMDMMHMRISNRLILTGLGIACIRSLICEGVQGLLTSVVLIFIPVISLYLLFLWGVLGAGDIKLFSLIGGFVNFKILIWCMFYSFAVAGVVAFILVFYYRVIKREKELHRMCFSIAILSGLVLACTIQG